MHLLLTILIGLDTVAGVFFGQWYQTTDLGHYLDNSNAYTIYETETTGQWNTGERMVFSISGNAYRNTRYSLNGMRIDSRTMPGHMLLHTGMDRTSLALDYHDGELFFRDDSVQDQVVQMTGNIGGLGGVSPGTKQMINLFHTSATQRTLDRRPMTMRNHIVGAGTAEATFAIPANGRRYYQHAYVNYGQRRLTGFDHTGINGMHTSGYYTAQLDGELPLMTTKTRLHYFLVTQGRADYGSEFYYNTNEQAVMRAYQAGLYSTTRLARQGVLVAGLSYELQHLNHDSLSFSRNLLDQDGEALEPWSPDSRLHSVNLSVRYDQDLLPWLRVHAEGYNSLLAFRPATRTWSNAVYAQSIADNTPTALYTYHWQSAPFAAGLLENEAQVIASHELTRGLELYGHLGVSLDGIVLGHGQSVISPNWQAKVAMTYQPCHWFRFGLSLSHHRTPYTWDEVRYLSKDYMNGEARFADNSLLLTTGGACHRIDKKLWMRQPSYAVLDIPLYFTFGKEHRHEIAILNNLRTYYNQWFTRFTDGVEANMTAEDGVYYMREGEKHYTVTTQPLSLLSSRPGCRTPYFVSNTIRYTYTGRKWFVQVSWQSYLMSGFSPLGNGPLTNTLGSLSETTANPNTFDVVTRADLPYRANGRLDQDRAFIARIQVTYNACKYFSIGLNGKFKDGQPFVNYDARLRTDADHTQVALRPFTARGINLANNLFGKREDAFFNIELHATGRWWIHDVPMSLDVLCYNLYDFGTALTEYTFDGYNDMRDKRMSMSLCIPRGLLVTLRIGLEKDQH